MSDLEQRHCRKPGRILDDRKDLLVWVVHPVIVYMRLLSGDLKVCGSFTGISTVMKNCRPATNLEGIGNG